MFNCVFKMNQKLFPVLCYVRSHTAAASLGWESLPPLPWLTLLIDALSASQLITQVGHHLCARANRPVGTRYLLEKFPFHRVFKESFFVELWRHQNNSLVLI